MPARVGHDHDDDVAEGRAHRSLGGEGHGGQHHQPGVADDLDARERGLARRPEAGARRGDPGAQAPDEEGGEEGEGDQRGDGAAGRDDQQQDHHGQLGQRAPGGRRPRGWARRAPRSRPRSGAGRGAWRRPPWRTPRRPPPRPRSRSRTPSRPTVNQPRRPPSVTALPTWLDRRRWSAPNRATVGRSPAGSIGPLERPDRATRARRGQAVATRRAAVATRVSARVRGTTCQRWSVLAVPVGEQLPGAARAGQLGVALDQPAQLGRGRRGRAAARPTRSALTRVSTRSTSGSQTKACPPVMPAPRL